MQGRNWIILAVAVVIGLIAVVLANAYFSGIEQRQEKVAEEQQLVRIVVATQELEFGARLTDQNIRLQNWPADSVPLGAFNSIPDALKDNRVALRPIVPGEPVLASKVSGTDGRATLAALLPEGLRAYSIPVSAVRGVAGFVLPGTMVDVLLTRQIEGDGADAQDLRADIVLENVQVLAVDQLASDKQGDPKVSKTATLAVTLHDAQRLSMAQRMGTLSLALRKVETAADSQAAGDAPRYARTLTSRQMGLPRLVIGKRPERSGSVGSVQPAMRSAGIAPSRAGTSMTVIRGTEPVVYPVGKQGGI